MEDLRVRTVERMRRLFALVLAAAQFVFLLMHHWPRKAVDWLRKLGGNLGQVQRARCQGRLSNFSGSFGCRLIIKETLQKGRS